MWLTERTGPATMAWAQLEGSFCVLPDGAEYIDDKREWSMGNWTLCARRPLRTF